MTARTPARADHYDVAIIGAGHNGLTCACYLARAGLKVGVFERRAIAGGAAVTEEFYPGFRNSTASYTVSLLHQQVIRDLHLQDHGLRIIERPMQNFVPLGTGAKPRNFCVGPASADTHRALAEFSPKDADRLADYYRMLDRVVAFLRDLLLRTPPANLRRTRDLLGLLSMGNAYRKLPASSQHEVHELFTRSAGELLDGWFESDALKALLGFDAVVGAFQSPYSPGSGYVLLHHAFGETNGKTGVWGHAIGGMGSITQAMSREALRHWACRSIWRPAWHRCAPPARCTAGLAPPVCCCRMVARSAPAALPQTSIRGCSLRGSLMPRCCPMSFGRASRAIAVNPPLFA